MEQAQFRDDSRYGRERYRRRHHHSGIDLAGPGTERGMCDVRLGVMMSPRLLGMKDETVRRADRQDGIKHRHSDCESGNAAFHGCW